MTDHTYENEHGGRTRGISRALKRALVPVAAVAALAGGVAAVAPTASAAPQTGPTVPGHPNELADATGHLPLTVHGPKGAIKHIKGGWVLSGSRWAVATAQSATPAVDVKHAFTVSTWVWTGNGRDPGVAISQGTGENSSFELGRTYDDAHPGGPALWSFDVNGQVGGEYTAYAPAARFHAANTWALLTGVWDPARHRAYLYVDGVLAASHYAPNVTTNPGGLVLGAAREGGGWDKAWEGLIGHVQVWNQALTPAQVLQIDKNGGPTHLKAAHSWLVA
ncbi:LamG domain-containing protein [Streptacidiphilus jiangxiensis]|uniref:Concanavalin A-like lectin/glucanases superfamily protein n=1 Tax=Streptacidiphilus jiangxiensis TaxID=235985 RepID=A0A1H7JKP6_STRJI|nr:LamG domain-containing protein [Streptacidiphilus jiangxiensis]SEK75142.1 Concanavalin A-like lectin/glucanases superfamily protein [Streptacidiphilus jiangxiensis]